MLKAPRATDPTVSSARKPSSIDLFHNLSPLALGADAPPMFVIYAHCKVHAVLNSPVACMRAIHHRFLHLIVSKCSWGDSTEKRGPSCLGLQRCVMFEGILAMLESEFHDGLGIAVRWGSVQTTLWAPISFIFIEDKKCWDLINL